MKKFVRLIFSVLLLLASLSVIGAGAALQGAQGVADENFLRAIKDQSWDEVHEFIKQGENVNGTSPAGIPVLQLIIEADEENEADALVQELILCGAKVNAADREGITALWLAASMGKVETTRMLLAAGANVNVRTQWGGSPLIAALDANNEAIASELLKRGARADFIEDSGYTAAFYAARSNQVSILASLHSLATSPKLRVQYWNDVLLGAARGGQLELARQAVAAKAGINISGTNGMTALLLAAMHGHKEMTAYLLSSGADKTLKAKNGIGLFLAAANGGLNEIVQKFITDPNESSQILAQTPIAVQFAALNNHESIVEILLKLKPKLDKHLSALDSPLISAIRHENASLARMLLVAGANPNEAVEIPPLMVAVGIKNSAMVSVLVNGGADVNFRSLADDISILALAIASGNIDALKAILKAKPNLALESNLHLPLELAARENFVPAIHALVAAGADVNARSSRGGTALHASLPSRSTFESKNDALKALLSYRPMLDQRNSSGATALMDACLDANVAAAQLLLNAGANHRIQNPAGKTALDLVRDRIQLSTEPKRSELRRIESLLVSLPW